MMPNLKPDKRVSRCKISKKTVDRSIDSFNYWYRVMEIGYEAKREDLSLLSRQERMLGIENILENHRLIKRRFDRAIDNYHCDVMTSEDVNVILNAINLYQEKCVG